MNIAILFAYIFGLVFHSWLVWIFYQNYLAAWGKKGAKDSWVNLLKTPNGQLFFPFFKWGGLALLAGGSINLLLLIFFVYKQFYIYFNSAT
jgi:hypothetical protein